MFGKIGYGIIKESRDHPWLKGTIGYLEHCNQTSFEWVSKLKQYLQTQESRLLFFSSNSSLLMCYSYCGVLLHPIHLFTFIPVTAVLLQQYNVFSVSFPLLLAMLPV